MCARTGSTGNKKETEKRRRGMRFFQDGRMCAPERDGKCEGWW